VTLLPPQIVIPHRSCQLTKAALKYASALVNGEDIRVRLIDVHVVPYGVPLNEHPGNSKNAERRLKQLAREGDVHVSPEVVYARDWEQGFRRALSPASTILMPIHRASWQTNEKRLAARLRSIGHTIVWVESD
jgi:hypothetical protein